MRTRSARLGMATTLVIIAAISACSGSVETSASAEASSSGSGGSTAQSGSAVASATSTTGEGGGPAFCGGKAGIQCAPGQFCTFNPPGSCGNADGGGYCLPIPSACPADCPGVCGCDGSFYCNGCGANAAGVDVSSTPAGSCLPDAGSPAIYSGQEVYTDVPRFALYKADPARDVCFRLVLEMFDSGPLGISAPPGWSVGKAEVTDHAGDCVGGDNGYPAPPLGKAVSATGGGGKIDFPLQGPHCLVSIHANLTFPPGAPFVPAHEPLDADMVPITGACPP
jgi:hypothetical protein